MEKGELILGRVNLNVGKDECSPAIEILDYEGATDGEVVVLRVERVSRWGVWMTKEEEKK
mgnify:CR=1 FL=1